MRKVSKFSIFLLVLDILACICLFLAYGPISYFRTLLITTAMETQSHHYLARTLYSDSVIAEVLNKNYLEESGESTKTSDITFNNEDDGNYDSIYEEQILKRDEGNDVYKLIEINENGYAGYMVVIYDPSKISLAIAQNLNKGGQTLPQISQTNNALLAINASGHYYPNGYGGGRAVAPAGNVIKDGKLYSPGVRPASFGGGFIGFTNDNVLLLTKGTAEEAIAAGMRDAVEFGPFLIVNGEPSNIVGNGGFGVAPRTAIAQRKDGIVLLLVIDGRSIHSIGIDMNSMIEIFMRYGAHNAANLDGGGSSTLVINHTIINKPQNYDSTANRYMTTAWIVTNE